VNGDSGIPARIPGGCDYMRTRSSGEIQVLPGDNVMWRTAAALFLLLALASPARPAGVSGYLGALEGGVGTRLDDLAGDPESASTVRQLEKILAILGKPTTGRDYAREVKSASKIAKILDGRLAGETALRALLDAVRDEYRLDLVGARSALAGLVAASGKKDRVRKQRQKQLKKGDKGLGKANAAASLNGELKGLATAAKALAEYIQPRGVPSGDTEDTLLLFSSDLDYDKNAQLFLAIS
jgi:hypothetical protein